MYVILDISKFIVTVVKEISRVEKSLFLPVGHTGGTGEREKMTKVKVEMLFDVDTEKHAVELKVLEHHAERLLDLDSYPEILSVYGVKVSVVEKESKRNEGIKKSGTV